MSGLRVVGTYLLFVWFVKCSDSNFSGIQATQLMFLVHSRIWELGIVTEVFRVAVLVGFCC